MNSLRLSLRSVRVLWAPLFALSLFSFSALSVSACSESDEGQTPSCPDNPPEGEECFTAPGSAATQVQVDVNPPDSQGGAAGSGGTSD